MREAPIKIGDTELNFAQVMTLRVGLSNFLMWLNDPASRDLGEIRAGYRARAHEVLQLMHDESNKARALKAEA